jgi:hypothetical protein
MGVGLEEEEQQNEQRENAAFLARLFLQQQQCQDKNGSLSRKITQKRGNWPRSGDRFHWHEEKHAMCWDFSRR